MAVRFKPRAKLAFVIALPRHTPLVFGGVIPRRLSMAFGRTITSFLTNLYFVDHLAPQVIGDFAHLCPVDPLKGAAVSDFATHLYPVNPISPANVGPSLSDFIQSFHVGDPGPGDGGFLL